ncbi:hypothetical protein AB0M83_18490 [Amycolatopsis sp. NPDC051106]|uniref:hypothetical protein n=1 Tax=unclassified Amycolatopsis TaxID=2618356 RepID=UPI003436E8DB
MAQMGEVSRRLCLAADARGYGRGNDLHQISIQRYLLEVMCDAAESVGLDRVHWHRQQGGDSEFAVLPAGTSEKVVVDQFVRELAACLARHNSMLREELRLRLRLAIHFGRVVPAANGHAGPALVELARILDSSELHAVLDANPAEDIAVALSDRVYEDTIQPGHTTHRAQDFRRVTIAKKEYTGTAWLWSPREGGPGPGDVAADPGPRPAPSPASVHTTVNGAVHGQSVVFGIQNG